MLLVYAYRSQPSDETHACLGTSCEHIDFHPSSPSGSATRPCRARRGPAGAQAPVSGVLTLAIDPVNPQVLYSGTTQGVSRSGDGGRTWRLVLRDSGYNHVVAIDPKDPRTVYAGVAAGIARRERGGRWRTIPSPTADPWLLVHDPTRRGVVWAGDEAALYRTTNAAANWRSADRTLPRPLGALALDPRRSGTAYVLAGEAPDVYKTTNGGSTWRAVLRTRGSEVIAIDAQRPSTVYVGGTGGFHKSTNGGVSWRRFDVLKDDLHPHGLWVDPRNSQILYAYSYCGGIVKSTNGGRAWRPASTGIAPTALTGRPDTSSSIRVTRGRSTSSHRALASTRARTARRTGDAQPSPEAPARNLDGASGVIEA